MAKHLRVLFLRKLTYFDYTLPQGAGEEEEQLREPLPRIRAGLAKGGAGLAEVVGQGWEVRAQRLQAVASR